MSVDSANDKITGTRRHLSMMIGKDADSFAPSLHKRASTGQTLESAEIKFTHLNDAGQEIGYHSVMMENVKIIGVNCAIPDVTFAGNDKMNHVENVSLKYEKITQKIIDGNISILRCMERKTQAIDDKSVRYNRAVFDIKI